MVFAHVAARRTAIQRERGALHVAPMRTPLLLSLVAAAITAGLLLALGWWPGPPRTPATGVVERPLPAGGDFELATAAGRFRTVDQRGKVVLLAFGYTSCPDVCPTTLTTIAAALDALPASEVAQVVPVFVSVDPARDTVERLASYVGYFHPAVRGATGTPAELAAVAARYDVSYGKVMMADGKSYTMDHSAELHLLGRDGAPRRRLPYDVPPAQLAAALHALVAPGPLALAATAAAAPAAPPPARGVTVTAQYVRAVPPGGTMTAAFMELYNPTASPRALIAAASPAAGRVELHSHVDDGGVMRMRQVPRIEVPAGGMVSLAPGGLHVMMFDLVATLADGAEVELELSFDDGTQLSVRAPVRAPAPRGSEHAH